eukprot:gene9563-biopygen1592
MEAHGDASNARACFQVASQLNCLEFASEREIPESGISCYATDHTQGPAWGGGASATLNVEAFLRVRMHVGNYVSWDVLCKFILRKFPLRKAVCCQCIHA